MVGRVGDRIVIESRKVDAGRKTGEIVEVIHGSGGEHYRVRWDGRARVGGISQRYRRLEERQRDSRGRHRPLLSRAIRLYCLGSCERWGPRPSGEACPRLTGFECLACRDPPGLLFAS
jgi:hypothetical protein